MTTITMPNTFSNTVGSSVTSSMASSMASSVTSSVTNVIADTMQRSISVTIREPYSALTHCIGILYTLVLAPIIIIRAAMYTGLARAIASTTIFMISMLLLYTASTVYHTFGIGDHYIPVLKKLDHCMIFVLIAGSYTPVCMLPLFDQGGIPLLLFVWGFAIVGVIFKLCWVTCPKWVSSVIYIGMGWSCIFALPALHRVLSPSAFGFLLAGGILYTVGGVLYALKLKAFNNRFRNFGSHEIFHVFVMLGNLAQFVCMWKILG